MVDKTISIYTLMKDPNLIKEIRPAYMREFITEERERHFRLGRFQKENYMERYVREHPFPKGDE